MRNRRCPDEEDTTNLALRPGDWPTEPESLALTPPSSSGGRAPLVEMSPNVRRTAPRVGHLPWEWVAKSMQHHKLTTLRIGKEGFGRISLKDDFTLMQEAAFWAYGDLSVESELETIRQEGSVLNTERSSGDGDNDTEMNDCFSLEFLEQHGLMELHLDALKVQGGDRGLLKAIFGGRAPVHKSDYTWILGQEGSLYRCLYTVDGHFERLAILKMWAVVAYRLCGWDAVEDVLVDIARLNVFNPPNFACSKGSDEGFAAYEYMVLSKTALERTWMYAIKNVYEVRDLMWPRVKWDFHCCGIHGVGCHHAPSFPGNAPDASRMSMAVYAREGSLVSIAHSGYGYV